MRINRRLRILIHHIEFHHNEEACINLLVPIWVCRLVNLLYILWLQLSGLEYMPITNDKAPLEERDSKIPYISASPRTN